MRLDQVISSSKIRLTQILRTLREEFGTRINFSDKDATDLLVSKAKNAIAQSKLSESFTNQYANTAVIKATLILEAVKIYNANNFKQVKKAKKKTVNEGNEFEKAELLMASKSIVDELQKIIQNVGDLQVKDIPLIIDRIKVEHGVSAAQNYRDQTYTSLQTVMDTLTTAKENIDNLTIGMGTGNAFQAAPTDQELPEPMNPQEPGSQGGMDQEEPTGIEAKAEREKAPTGRERKEESFIQKKDKTLNEFFFLGDDAKSKPLWEVSFKPKNNQGKTPIKVKIREKTAEKAIGRVKEQHTEVGFPNAYIYSAKKLTESKQELREDIELAAKTVLKLVKNDHFTLYNALEKVTQSMVGRTEDFLQVKKRARELLAQQKIAVNENDTPGMKKQTWLVQWKSKKQDKYDTQNPVMKTKIMATSGQEAIEKAKKDFSGIKGDFNFTAQKLNENASCGATSAGGIAQTPQPIFKKKKKTVLSRLPEAGEQELDEKWAKPAKTNPAKKGMFDGKSLAELKSERARLKKKENHTKAESTKLRELNYAIRAKTGWGKVSEGFQVVATSHWQKPETFDVATEEEAKALKKELTAQQFKVKIKYKETKDTAIDEDGTVSGTSSTPATPTTPTAPVTSPQATSTNAAQPKKGKFAGKDVSIVGDKGSSVDIQDTLNGPIKNVPKNQVTMAMESKKKVNEAKSQGEEPHIKKARLHDRTLEKFSYHDFLDMAHARLGHAIAQDLEDVLHGHAYASQNIENLEKIQAFVEDKDEHTLANDIRAYLQGKHHEKAFQVKKHYYVVKCEDMSNPAVKKFYAIQAENAEKAKVYAEDKWHLDPELYHTGGDRLGKTVVTVLKSFNTLDEIDFLGEAIKTTSEIKLIVETKTGKKGQKIFENETQAKKWIKANGHHLKTCKVVAI